jgi:hypothetical protein
VTHEYTLLVGGRVIRGDDAPDATAIAWAADTILAIGSDDEVRAISRGDSHVVDLAGATVMPPESGTALEPGGPADLAILADGRAVAVVRGGRVVSGSLHDLLVPGRHGPASPPER